MDINSIKSQFPIFNKKIDAFFLELDEKSHNEITRVAKNDIFKLWLITKI